MLYLVFFFLELVALYFLSRRVKKTIFRFLRKVIKSNRWSTYIYAVLFLPGTFIHEIAHLLAAIFTGVRVSDLKLLPEIEDDKVKLGSVSIGKTDFVRETVVGTAPFFFGVGIILGATHFLLLNHLATDWLIVVLYCYLIFQVANSMFLSTADLTGAYKIVVLVLLIYLVLIALGINVSIGFQNTTGPLARVFEKGSLFLLVPIAIDGVLVILTSVQR